MFTVIRTGDNKEFTLLSVKAGGKYEVFDADGVIQTLEGTGLIFSTAAFVKTVQNTSTSSLENMLAAVEKEIEIRTIPGRHPDSPAFLEADGLQEGRRS